jgi:glycosyltransferase involved in cell wall biosynthesis
MNNIKKHKKIKVKQELPYISYIIPTYNAEKFLKRCLDSIFMQDYPKDLYEVLIADGRSIDETLNIINTYKNTNDNIKLLINFQRDSDNGKYIALKEAKGEILVFLDSDNIIVTSTWLQKMVVPLMENPDLLGVESNYLIADDFPAINTYSNLLVIVDPLARLLASKPYKAIKKNGYDIKYFAKNSAPVAGANGFLWRKSIVEKYNDMSTYKFAETNLLAEIALVQEVSYANIPNVGIYHYYCTNINDYFKKRVKIAKKFLKRRSQKDMIWTEQRGLLRFYSSVLYLLSVIGPSIEACINFVRSRRIEWLWHPFISFSTVIIYTYQLFTYKDYS